MTTSRRQAFTLIELLLAISIVALLVSMLLPSLKAARIIAQDLRCKANLRSLGTAVQLYYNAYDTVPVPPTSLIDVPAGHTELATLLSDYLDAEPPTVDHRRDPWACPSDTMKWPDTGGSYIYYPRILYDAYVLNAPFTTMRAIMQSPRRIAVAHDWFPQHGARFNVVYMDGGVDSLKEAIVFSYR